MKSNLETISTLERKLNIEVPLAEVQAAFENAFRGIQKHANVKGFRKGKVPINTIKSLYFERIQQDVVQEIIQSNYVTALREHSLDPVCYPTIEFDPIEAEKDFQFSAEFEVRPEVAIAKTEGLLVKKEKLSMTEEWVNSRLEDLRATRSEFTPLLEDRPAQIGDVAVIDFKGTIGGQDLEKGSAEGHTLELGSNSFIPGFEEGIVGMRLGVTITLHLKFPENYHADLAGKDVDFVVTLKELKKKSLPDLTDEFASSFGPYANIEALREGIKDDYRKREEKRIHDDLKNRLMHALVDANPVRVPKSMMTEQKKALLVDFEERMKQQGMPEEQFNEYKEKWDADFEKTASYMIQASFLVERLALDHGLRATSAEVDQRLKDYAAQSGIELKRVHEFYGDKDRKARLAYQLTEEKVIEFVLAKANVVEVTKEQLEGEQVNKI